VYKDPKIYFQIRMRLEAKLCMNELLPLHLHVVNYTPSEMNFTNWAMTWRREPIFYSSVHQLSRKRGYPDQQPLNGHAIFLPLIWMVIPPSKHMTTGPTFLHLNISDLYLHFR
jgi:hypothetical protein